MHVKINRESVAALGSYAGVSAAFTVDRTCHVDAHAGETGHFQFHERPLATPYMKDYDSVGDGGPLGWPTRFDLARWILLGAYVYGRRAGGAAVAFDTPELTSGRDDLAVLWDIRVDPVARGYGIGSALFNAAEAVAHSRGCRQLLAETQNVNAAACRFYGRHGCVLRAVHRYAYPSLPDEIQLLWYKDLYA